MILLVNVTTVVTLSAGLAKNNLLFFKGQQIIKVSRPFEKKVDLKACRNAKVVTMVVTLSAGLSKNSLIFFQRSTNY